MQISLRIATLAAFALLAGGLSARAAEPPTVKVRLWDKPDGSMGIELSQSKVKAGPVEFEVTNSSKALTHEFLIVRHKGSVKSLPYDSKENEVDEDKLHSMQGIEDMPAGQTAKLRLVLRAGDYVVFCNQTGHYKMGMEQPLTVTH